MVGDLEPRGVLLAQFMRGVHSDRLDYDVLVQLDPENMETSFLEGNLPKKVFVEEVRGDDSATFVDSLGKSLSMQLCVLQEG